MKCELGAESLRPRWGRRGRVGGLHGTNSRLCCRGWRHHDLPSSPPPLQTPTPTATATTTLWLPACSLIHRSLWPRLQLLASADLWKSSQIAMWGSTPQPRQGVEMVNAPLAAADACCLTYITRQGWLSAESSTKSTSIYFDSSKIKANLKWPTWSCSKAVRAKWESAWWSCVQY